MRGDEGFELGDKRVVASEGEVCVDPGLERRQSELLQTGDLGLGESLEGEVRKCRSPPECERIPERQRSGFWLTARELPPTLLQQSLEAPYVERVRRNTQHVTRGVREQELFAGSVCEKSPQPREIDAQDRVDRLWGSISPQLLDEPLAPDGLVRVQEEKAEERALLRATERECLFAPDDFKRSEDAKLEFRLPLRRSMVRLSFCKGERPRLRLLDVFVPFGCRFLRGLIVVACVFSGASIPWASRFFSGSSWRSCSCQVQLHMRLRAG